MGFHSLLTDTIEGDIKHNVGPITYGLAQSFGQLNDFNKEMSSMRDKSTLTQQESNEALSRLSQGLLGNTNITQETIAPKIAEWQHTSDNFYQNQRDVAAKATADARDKAFSDFDAIGVEDPNEVYSNITTTKPAPSFRDTPIANNYNTPSLLGNAQAAEGDALAPQPSGSILGGVIDYAKENAGVIGAGAIAAKALANTRGWAEHGATKKTLGEIGKQSWGKTWGQEKVSGYDKNFKAKPGAVKVSHPSYIKQGVKSLFGNYAPGSNVGGGTPLSQKGFQYSNVKNILNSPTAKVLSKVANRLGLPGLLWGVGTFIYNNNPAFHRTGEERLKDKRDYRRGKREERAEEVRAKAQAVADAKAKVAAEAKAAEEAKQTEREKQRMIESNSFSDTDSGSFDSGGNYSDWGSQESYDDDFGEDSHW